VLTKSSYHLHAAAKKLIFTWAARSHLQLAIRHPVTNSLINPKSATQIPGKKSYLPQAEKVRLYYHMARKDKKILASRILRRKSLGVVQMIRKMVKKPVTLRKSSTSGRPLSRKQ
jgi:hypothetical protein